MKFTSNDRPNINIINCLKNGETPFNLVPFKNESDVTFIDTLASERYENVIQTLVHYTNINTPINGLQNIDNVVLKLYNSYNNVTQLESNIRRDLEKLAIKLVIEETGIDINDLEFDVKIVALNEMEDDDMKLNENKEEEEEEEGDELNFPEFNVPVEEDENFNNERAKRRLINSITQGASKIGHYMYHLVSDEINDISGSSELIKHYGILMSSNDALYWQIDDEMIKNDLRDNVGGLVKVTRPENEDEKTKIKIRAINFPILIHELLKSVYETLSLHGLPSNDEVAKKVIDLEDTLFNELWDLRLGPSIWDRLKNAIPMDVFNDKELFLNLFMFIYKLPADEFLDFMTNVLANNSVGNHLMKNMIIDVKNYLNDLEFNDSISSNNEDNYIF